MRENLIKQIKNTKDVTNVIVFTHNIDFIFLQSVVLRVLKYIGHPKLTVFADAHCSAESYATQNKVLDSIGIRYRVVPVLMEPGFRFHPKAVFLSGPGKGTLLIGSGNLTFGGWFENAEVWIRFDSDVDGTAQFSSFKNYLKQVISLVPLSDTLLGEFEEAFDPNTKDWCLELDEPSGILGKVGRGVPLIDQIIDSTDKNNINNLLVCTPYFDTEAEALNNLVESFGNVPTKVMVQKGRSGLNKSAASKFSDNIKVVPITFIQQDSEGNSRERFIHAKFYAVDKEDSVTVFLGSANCSRAALTIPGSSGNAELLAIKTLRQNEFRQQFLDELELLEGDAELSEHVEELNCEPEGVGQIRVLAARYEAPDLLIGYTCSKEVSVYRCFVNEIHVDFELLGNCEALVKFDRSCRVVRIEGIINNEIIHSNLCWIDHEIQLRTSARGRSLVDTIRGKVISDYWNIGAWADVLDVFCKHLQYVPYSSGSKIFNTVKRDKTKELIFSSDDVFSSDYSIHFTNSGTLSLSHDVKIRNLQQLLLRWFGISAYEESSDDADLPSDDENDEDFVDKPEHLPQKNPKLQPQIASDGDKKRAKKFIGNLNDTICNQMYLENRPPELFALDLKLVTVLLLTGLRENWISYDEFFEVTFRIWSKLFFTSQDKENMGWLEYRCCAAESSEGFIKNMISADLSAALFVWSLAIPFDFSTPNNAIFSLSSIISVARLPWLWRGGKPDQIANILEKDFLQFIFINKSDHHFFDAFKKRWLILIRFGQVIKRFENELGNRNVVHFKDMINQDFIPKGELLWQGSLGFCISTRSYDRNFPYFAKVLSIHGESKELEFKPDSLIPVRALIDESIIPTTKNFNDLHKKYLRALIKRIRDQFAKKL